MESIPKINRGFVTKLTKSYRMICKSQHKLGQKPVFVDRNQVTGKKCGRELTTGKNGLLYITVKYGC